MAIGIYFSPAAMSAAKYDECIKLLKKAGAGNPAGRSYHAAFEPERQTDGVRCLDIASGVRNKFGKTLMPIVQQLGIDVGQPTVMPVHKVMVPTAKVASPRKRAKSLLAGRSADSHRTGLGVSLYEKARPSTWSLAFFTPLCSEIW